MNKDEKTKEKICAFYAGNYHFEMVSIPYINKKLENNEEIIILTENDLEETIKKLLSNINLKENKKENILKINWKNEDTEKIKKIEKNANENKNTVVFIKGKEKYINNTNKNIEKLLSQNNNINIIDCYDIQEVGEDLEKLMSQYNKILSTTRRKRNRKIIKNSCLFS